MAAGEVTIKVTADTKSFDKQIEQVERELRDLEKAKHDIDIGKKSNWDYGELEASIEKTKNKLISLRQEKNKLNQTGFQDTGFQLNDIGNKVEGIIRKVGRWALAVFSVRSAYNLIRQASSTLAQYNEQYGADIAYIRFALAQALAPVLEYIVNLARTLLAYINYIANAWFGVNLFANASADAFKKAKNNIGGANKAAKELQKTLTGFDEMNILNSTSTGGGGGVGGAIPSFDLSDLNDIVIPDWLKWIGENKDKIIKAITEIAMAFLIFKTLQILGIFDALGKGFMTLINSLGLIKGTLVSIGLVAIFAGIAVAIYGIIQYIQDPCWDNFKIILYGLEVAILGVAAAMIALNATNPVGWIILLVDAIALLTTYLIDLNKEEEEEVTWIETLIEHEKELKEARTKLTNATNSYINAVENAEEKERLLKEAQDETGISIGDLLELMEKENLDYKDLNEQQRKVYKAYVDNKGAQENLQTKTEELNEATKHQTYELKGLMLSLKNTSKNADEYKKSIIDMYKKGELSAEEASLAIMYAMDKMDIKNKEIFTQDLPNDIQKGLDPNKYKSFMDNFTNTWNNSFMKGLRTELKLNASANIQKSYSTGGYVTKLATGGLINLPGRGVPVSNAIAGEAGTEGIIPLTDSQAMQKLGEAIGRYITINANITNTMNGRVISRQLDQIRQDRDFAYNT